MILVGHKKDANGLRRTRRLFTTLNKTAVPVRKRDIISLDEDDVMAIIARRLVLTNPSFRDPKIAVISSQNIPAGNRVCLTTIANLYDLLKLIFSHDVGRSSNRRLRFNRPSDEQLDRYYLLATSYFESIGEAFAPVGELFAANDPAKVTAKYRGPRGGHLLFRPLGLEIFTRVAIQYASENHIEITESVRRLRTVPTDLDKLPYRGVLWNPIRNNLVVKGKTLAHGLLRYMAGLEARPDELLRQYKEALGAEPGDRSVKLPGRVV